MQELPSSKGPQSDSTSDSRVRSGAASAGAVLLTGGTGFVGMELLARYLERTDRTVFVLIRADDAESAARRLRETLANVLGPAAPHADRAIALAGDLTRPRLGLEESAAEAVAERVSEIVHGAASVSFDLGLEESREINVEGTRRMLSFAERCQARGGLRRLSYISTAYVAGKHTGTFAEDDLFVGQRFRNAYEQSKFEAEQLVGRHRSGLPITVVRPSIIVGDSRSGWTASLNVLYWPLRALARGAYPVLPARVDAPVDVVSVDYVADAIFALTHTPAAEGHAYHLTASARASTIGELLQLACSGLRCRKPPVISPSLYRHVVRRLLLTVQPRARAFLRATEAYLPYFAMDVGYDNSRARAALEPAEIAPAPLADYFDRLVDYAVTADWGAPPAHPRAIGKRQSGGWPSGPVAVTIRGMRQARVGGGRRGRRPSVATAFWLGATSLRLGLCAPQSENTQRTRRPPRLATYRSEEPRRSPVTRQPYQVKRRTPLGGGVRLSALRCAPRATRRAPRHDTPIARIRRRSEPSYRVPG